jgi:hypothetical protein
MARAFDVLVAANGNEQPPGATEVDQICRAIDLLKPGQHRHRCQPNLRKVDRIDQSSRH